MKVSKNPIMTSTANKQLSVVRQDRNRYIAFAFASAHLFLEITRQTEITYISGSAGAFTQKGVDDLKGRKLTDFIAPEDKDYFQELLNTLYIHHRTEPRPLRMRTVHNKEIILMMGGFIMPDNPGIIHLSFMVPSKAAVGALNNKVDPETGLLKQKAFSEVAADQLEVASRMGKEAKLTLFVLEELDEIKNIGDPFAVTRALDKISAYLRAISLDGGVATQFDDQKYGLLHDSEVSEEEIRTRINQIIQEEVDNAPRIKSFSIDFDPGELEEEDAAKALSYSIQKFIKEDPDSFSISSLQSSAREMMHDTLGRISRVRDIIEQRNFDVVYQPIVDLYMEEPHHLEALTRVTGLPSPQEFIQFTEEVGLIEDFDLALTQKVLEDLEGHARSGWRPKIAINISARSMASKLFINSFKEIIAPYESVKKQLMLELTETVAVSNFEKLNATLQDFRRQGIEVCLDDVGSGSTSFQSLYDLQVDYLKIEGKFVREASENPRDMAMLKSIIKNGKQLGCKLIAEQIEDPDQARLMESLEIDFGQGYLYGRPTMDHSMLRSHKKASGYRAGRRPKQPVATDEEGNPVPKHHISMNLRRGN